MNNNERTIYGIRIVPHEDKKGIRYGKFEGIVISCCSVLDIDSIVISKMIIKDNGYFTDSFISIPYEELSPHNNTSGKAKAEFLVSKAKDLAKGNEEIAICDTLIPHLRLMDFSWERSQKLLKEQKTK